MTGFHAFNFWFHPPTCVDIGLVIALKFNNRFLRNIFCFFRLGHAVFTSVKPSSHGGYYLIQGDGFAVPLYNIKSAVTRRLHAVKTACLRRKKQKMFRKKHCLNFNAITKPMSTHVGGWNQKLNAWKPVILNTLVGAKQEVFYFKSSGRGYFWSQK